MSVKVAVRVRPFNNREIELGSQLCVEMSGQKTTLLNLEDQKKNREFTFDFSFWSHSGFEQDSEGKSISIDGKYSDQRQVYELVGSQMLDNAWAGYHCCLLAYGQTGSGKSYSMVGYKPNRGIVPIACEEIFKRINNSSSSTEFEVCLSMLEIYNEKVQDLLIPSSKRPQGGLRIRENKTIGFYVEHLTKYPVKSYDAIEARMDEGAKNRSIASTQMNASSSRAHTIITIEFRRREMINEKKVEKFSMINLVDLAGSEKVGKTGATGDRLKEAGQINKSLHILGLVIMTLAELEGGKKHIKVPYRDSCLTRILCNALGGNSKTLMICAISPSNDNYDETLSTLRYADQAKRIKNRAIVNESADDKLIRELTTENQILKSTIMELRQKLLLNPGFGRQEIEALEDELEAMDDLMKCMKITHEQRVQETQLEELNNEEDEDEDNLHVTMHLTNLNEDPMLNNKVKFRLDKETTFVGRKTATPPPDIILGSAGIKENHAIFSQIDHKVYLSPVEEECSDFIFLNGEKVYGQRELFHNDRIIFGMNSVFLVYSPDEIERPGSQLPKIIDWEFAQDEVSKHEGTSLEQFHEIDFKEKQLRNQIDEKMRAFEVERELERKEYNSKIKDQIDNYENKLVELGQRIQEESQKQRLEKEQLEYESNSKEIIAKLEAERIQKELEREKQKQELERQEQHRIYKLTTLKTLERRLLRAQRKAQEVGIISKELKRDFIFQPIITYMYIDASEISTKTREPKINILVKNLEEGYEYEWDLDKFYSRYDLIKELLNRYFETNEMISIQKNEDPFWDPPEQTLIGQGYIKLFGIANGLDFRTNIKLINQEKQCGTLEVYVVPCTPDGKFEYSGDDCNQLEIDDPNDLLNRQLDFKIKILQAQLPQNFCQDTFVEYSLLFTDGSSKKPSKFRTQKILGKIANPQFDYSLQHTYKHIQQNVIQYLSSSTVEFCVFGFDDARVQQMKIAQQRRKETLSKMNITTKKAPISSVPNKLKHKQTEKTLMDVQQMKLKQQKLDQGQILKKDIANVSPIPNSEQNNNQLTEPSLNDQSEQTMNECKHHYLLYIKKQQVNSNRNSKELKFRYSKLTKQVEKINIKTTQAKRKAKEKRVLQE